MLGYWILGNIWVGIQETLEAHKTDSKWDCECVLWRSYLNALSFSIPCGEMGAEGLSEVPKDKAPGTVTRSHKEQSRSSNSFPTRVAEVTGKMS